MPDELPPVQPPSARFIVQLFVVPGLIVAAIFGVWVLFGKLAAPDTDWRSQLVELQHPNKHRRWRGALGLAQMLKADQDLGESSQHLARNREMAQTLSQTLTDELKRVDQSDEEFNYQAFLARTLGLFDLPDVVFPALKQAMAPERDREVRKNAISSIAVMTDRMTSAHQSVPSAEFVTEVAQISTDNDPLIRQLCAFTLGLFSEPAAIDRLEVLLQDSDRDTRLNAAVGLARQSNVGGGEVFAAVIRRAAATSSAAKEEYEEFVSVWNSLAAIQRLADQWPVDRRAEFTALLEPMASSYREPKIRIKAQEVLSALSTAK